MAKKDYIAPKITTITFKNERGYATSGAFSTAMLLIMTDRIGGGGANQETETFSVHDDWTEGSGNFW